MSYPGNNHYNYQGQGQNGGGYGGGYGGGPGGFGGPPPGPPPGGFGGPPPGPPPGFQGGYGGGYGQQQGGYGGQQGGYNQQGGYGGQQGGYGGQQGGYGQQQGGYGGQQQQQHQQQQQGGHSSGYGAAAAVAGAAMVAGAGYNSSQSSGGRGNYNSPEHMNQIPTGMQQFGSGAPNQYSYQYSNCSGRRKALLIGINYIGTKSALRGCINDVNNIRNFLLNNGYKSEDMVVLTDDQQNQRSIPTKANMIAAMQWLVKGAQPNDSLFFHYSGHGGQTEDLNGDEEDGFDEVIYPLDFQTAGHIIDDDLHSIMVTPLTAGVRLTAIFDSCHSGTVLDLPYVYSTQGVIKEPNLAKEAGQGLLSAFSSYSRGDLSGAISTITGIVKQATNGGGNKASELTRRTKTSPADVITFSGCKDSQTSADASEAGKATGAMSYAFIEVMGSNPNQSYLSLLQNMRQLMAAKYSQKPQLSASHPIDVNLKFIF
ncbi:caspase domain-containing protein [Myxozyma melibiosi]|uniref:Metacaspase-1 n=1 Tax=Myxozyma melibiosi TaxID=54550 RepID=A0ABR1F8H8_9ASCO